jgi:hypothetical protein
MPILKKQSLIKYWSSAFGFRKMAKSSLLECEYKKANIVSNNIINNGFESLRNIFPRLEILNIALNYDIK